MPCAFSNRIIVVVSGKNLRPSARSSTGRSFQLQIPGDERARLSIWKGHCHALSACKLRHACAVTAHLYFVAHLPGPCMSGVRLRMLRIVLRFVHLARPRCDRRGSQAVATLAAYSTVQFIANADPSIAMTILTRCRRLRYTDAHHLRGEVIEHDPPAALGTLRIAVHSFEYVPVILGHRREASRGFPRVSRKGSDIRLRSPRRGPAFLATLTMNCSVTPPGFPPQASSSIGPSSPRSRARPPAKATQVQRRGLITQRLAGASWHDRESVGSAQHIAEDRFLTGAQAVNAEDFMKRRPETLL